MRMNVNTIKLKASKKKFTSLPACDVTNINKRNFIYDIYIE